ncbi:MAG: septum formation initiator family protein [Oscillospiraceae bacterium]|nr:septum formation initiator family protein [Oscillospiraceae bacterium]MBR0451032.1 septum formation initiator family protein [Oscillospiraceae bacterium]MDO5137313.1 septum formation initiator family protein [Oscillospiraceae bacterium]
MARERKADSIEVKARQAKQFRRRLVLTILSVACIYLLIAVISVRWRLHQQEEKLEAVMAEIAVARQENDELVRILNGSDEEIIERIAREKLGYAAVGERVFEDIYGFDN